MGPIYLSGTSDLCKELDVLPPPRIDDVVGRLVKRAEEDFQKYMRKVGDPDPSHYKVTTRTDSPYVNDTTYRVDLYCEYEYVGTAMAK